MRSLFILFTVFYYFSINAQVTQRNLLINKYSLVDINQSIVPLEKFKPFPRTPTEWKQLVSDSILNKLVSDGELGLKFKFNSIPFSAILAFKNSGNRLLYEDKSFLKRTVLLQMTVAESIEGKGRFLNAIMDGVWSICDESYWGVPAHITETQGVPDLEKPYVELFSAETATAFGLVNYFLGDKLDSVSPLLRKRITIEIDKRFFKPLVENIHSYKGNGEAYKYLSQTNKVNNWNPWIMSNFIATNLLIEKDNAQRSALLYEAMQGLDRYFNGLGDDGGCDEGLHYWQEAGASAFDCLEWLQKATNSKVDIFNEPLIKKMASYIYKMHIGGSYFVNIGDGEPSIKHLNGAFLYRFGSAVNDEQMKQFGTWAFDNCEQSSSIDSFHKVRSIENFLTIKEMPLLISSYKPAEHIWINDVQTMTARTKGNLFLASHAGNNGKSHNHNDVGDFIIYLNNEPFIIDAGRGTYTAKTFSDQRYELWNNQSQYHNLPTINGIGEYVGKEFAAKEVVNTNTAKEDKLTMDITGAYPKEAGIITWKRTNSLLKDKEEVCVMDEYVFDKQPTSLQQTFMTVTKVDLSQKGKVIFIGDKDKLVLSYDDALFSVRTETPSMTGPEYGKLLKFWDNKVITRVLFTAKIPQAKGTFVYKFKKVE